MFLKFGEKIDLNKKNLVIDRAVLEEGDFYNNKNIESLTIAKSVIKPRSIVCCQNLKNLIIEDSTVFSNFFYNGFKECVPCNLTLKNCHIEANDFYLVSDSRFENFTLENVEVIRQRPSYDDSLTNFKYAINSKIKNLNADSVIFTKSSFANITPLDDFMNIKFENCCLNGAVITDTYNLKINNFTLKDVIVLQYFLGNYEIENFYFNTKTFAKEGPYAPSKEQMRAHFRNTNVKNIYINTRKIPLEDFELVDADKKEDFKEVIFEENSFRKINDFYK